MSDLRKTSLFDGTLQTEDFHILRDTESSGKQQREDISGLFLSSSSLLISVPCIRTQDSTPIRIVGTVTVLGFYWSPYLLTVFDNNRGLTSANIEVNSI